MAEITVQAMKPGFTDYVVASQRVFRLSLNCLSRPCRALEFDRGLLPGDPVLPLVSFSLALTLLDSTTPAWLSPSWKNAEDWLRFHRGCPIYDRPEKAAFILAASLVEMPPLVLLNQGTARYPDSSATVILGSVLPLNDQNPLQADGPGIDGSLIFKGHGLDRYFLAQWQNNRSRYPLGVDIFLAGETHLAGLPRSVNLKEMASEKRRSCM